jgi:glycerol-3-phosphate dehydrogenase
MKRYQPQEKERLHDLVIVGGGIYGASMAYTAALNGLDTVLLEQDDFTQHTSANSQKVIHGGIRYLQSFDLKRVVESIREKHRFYHLFPHQVRPLPCLFPTSGYLTQGNGAFRIAFLLYSMLEKWLCKSFQKTTLRSKILSREEVLRHFPHLQKSRVRGGALWYDGICLEPERVILSLLKSVVQHGGQVANHMQVTAFHREKDGIFSVELHDTLDERKYQIRTRKIALCTGPWFQDKWGKNKLPPELEELSLVRGMNLVVPSLFSSATSLATKVKDEISSRFLFVVPWKGYSIEGTYWEDCSSFEEKWSEHKAKAAEFHDLHLSVLHQERGDVPVLASHVGYVPGRKEKEADASRNVLSHYLLVEREEEKKGDVLQVVGVKFTTAFNVTLKALKHLFPDEKVQDVLTFAELPYGSPAISPEDFFRENREKFAKTITEKQYSTLFQLFGVKLDSVVEHYIRPQKGAEGICSQDDFYKGVARYCIEQEMTYHLTDLVQRRIFPDQPELLPDTLVDLLATEMAVLLNWTKEQQDNELQRLQKGRGFS